MLASFFLFAKISVFIMKRKHYGRAAGNPKEWFESITLLLFFSHVKNKGGKK